MPKGRILLADASPELLAEGRRHLEASGYEVITAADGEEARTLVATRRPDGVIAAQDLPVLDGTALVSHLGEKFQTIPCYLTVPADDDGLIEECLAAGARNVLVRPLRRRELLFAARALVSLRSLLRAQAGRTDDTERTPPPGARGLVMAAAGEEEKSPGAHFFQFELFKKLLAMELKRSRRYGFPLSVLLVAPDGEPVLGQPPVASTSPEERTDAKPGAEADTPSPTRSSVTMVSSVALDARTIVGRAVTRAIRDIDVACDFPDERILVVMPHTDLDGALVVAERIRRRVRSSVGAITASIGATSLNGGGRLGFEQLLGRASRALEEARATGGDRIAQV